jgi:hypothetical protein
MRLETSLGTVKDKQSLDRKQKCFNCGKTECRPAKCPPPQKKDSWKRPALQQMQALRKPNLSAVAAANQVTRKRTAGKKHSHKAPSRSSMEVLGAFLDEELLVCNNAQDKMPYVTQEVEAAYYCVSIIEDG